MAGIHIGELKRTEFHTLCADSAHEKRSIGVLRRDTKALCYGRRSGKEPSFSVPLASFRYQRQEEFIPCPGPRIEPGPLCSLP